MSFSIFTVAIANDIEGRRDDILKIIDEELSEVNRLSTRGGEKDPDLLLRIAELYLEKARLYRERENINYLKLAIDKRQKVDKKRYFSTSNKYFNLANQSCLKITKRYKRYNKMGEVYYILGFNAKEAGQNKNAVNFLKKSSKFSTNKTIKIKSLITMADIHFNNKKFESAKKLYESALKQHTDQWWTKDAFNLAWSYYHLNRYSDAISKMLEVYSRSKSNKFINMEQQVERDIGYFYATSGRIDDGIDFYKKVGVNFTGQLSTIAFTLKSTGKFKEAQKVLNYALKYNKDANSEVDISLELLDLFQKSGHYDKHLDVVRNLHKLFGDNVMNLAQVKIFKFQMEKVAAILQRQVLSKTYKGLKSQRSIKAKQVDEYFEILSQIASERYDEFQYLRGETSFAVNEYDNAFNAYKNTYEFSKKHKLIKFKRKALDNMLICLEYMKKSTNQTIYAFEEFVMNYPRDKNVSAVYERLFNNYISVSNYDMAKNTLNRYSKQFPKNITQEAMIAKLMDIDRKNGDNNAVRRWVVEIENGQYFVSTKYKNKLQELLTTMQMEDVQTELKKGNKTQALIGYHEVLKDKYSTKRSKINAKYNLAALYFELGDVDNTYKWSMTAIDEMKTSDVLKFQNSFITIANFLFMSLSFKESATLSHKILSKTCFAKKSKNNLLLKNAGYIYIADNRIEEAENVLKMSAKCHLSTSVISELNYELMRESYLQKDYNKFEHYVSIVAKDKNYQAKAVEEYIKLYFIYRELDNKSKMNLYLKLAQSYYVKSKKLKNNVSLDALNFFAQIEFEKMLRTENELEALELKYPEQIFKQLVEKHLALLDRLVEQANAVIRIGSGDGIIKAYALLNNSYLKVGKRLASFVPPGKNQEYLDGFKKQFSIMSQQMYEAANSYRSEANNSIDKNEILSEYNFKLQKNNPAIRFFSSGVLMDRRGGK